MSGEREGVLQSSSKKSFQNALMHVQFSLPGMGGTRIFLSWGQQGGKAEGRGGQKKIVVIGLSTEENWKTSSKCFGR